MQYIDSYLTTVMERIGIPSPTSDDQIDDEPILFANREVQKKVDIWYETFLLSKDASFRPKSPRDFVARYKLDEIRVWTDTHDAFLYQTWIEEKPYESNDPNEVSKKIKAWHETISCLGDASVRGISYQDFVVKYGLENVQKWTPVYDEYLNVVFTGRIVVN